MTNGHSSSPMMNSSSVRTGSRNQRILSNSVNYDNLKTILGSALRDDKDTKEVKKSPVDKKSYKTLRLRNGLFVLLVHDPDIYPVGYDNEEIDSTDEEHESKELDSKQEGGEEDDDGESSVDEEVTSENGDESDENEEQPAAAAPANKKAAAAMCVAMGSFKDPPKAQGLAHFLEHMLFMGTDEFPGENEYASYLSKHGGSSNAYTEMEYTCYYFDVNPEFLHGALKRFSQFFISPRMKEDTLEREILAIDSEFSIELQDDSERLLQLQCHTASPNHPINRFSWGNKKSLYDDMHEEVLKMFNENYHGGVMKLVVIGGEPIEELEKWVTELFTKVKSSPPIFNTADKEKHTAVIWEDAHKKKKLYKLEAVQYVNRLVLSWPLPCLNKDYLRKPHYYLSHLIGHKGKGSLFSLLKAKGYATSLRAGVESDGTHMSAFAYIFSVSIQVTSEGLEKIYEIIGAVYQYIKLLRQSRPQKWIFKELQNIGKINFKYAEEQSQGDNAVHLSVNSLSYPEKHIIWGDYAYDKWDPKRIDDILSYFRPDNMRIDLLTKSFDHKDKTAVQYEPWFGSRYIEEDIPQNVIDTWKDPVIDPLLHLPQKNKFIPSDFTIRSAGKSSEQKCIVNEPLIKLWHKMDQTFDVPRVNVNFSVYLKDAYSNLKNYLLRNLFVVLLRDTLNSNEQLSQATIAGLSNSLYHSDDKMEIQISGYNDKLSDVVSIIFSTLRSLKPKIHRFKVIKEDMERTYRNMNLKPLDHSSNLRSHILYKRSWAPEEQLKTLENLTFHDLEDFKQNLLSQMYIEGHFHGNLTEQEAIKISRIIIRKTLHVKPLPKELLYRSEVLSIPNGTSLLVSANVENKSETNSVVELYFQFERQLEKKDEDRLRYNTDLFGDLVKEPFFNQLRTKEQLGYIVECGPCFTSDVQGFYFIIQSSKYNPIQLQNRIDNFLDGLPKLLDADIDDASFKHHRSALAANKLRKATSLAEEAGNYWACITTQRYNYGIQNAEELKTIQKSDVIEFYNTYIKRDSEKCRRLAIHVCGCNTSDAADNDMEKTTGSEKSSDS